MGRDYLRVSASVQDVIDVSRNEKKEIFVSLANGRTEVRVDIEVGGRDHQAEEVKQG